MCVCVIHSFMLGHKNVMNGGSTETSRQTHGTTSIGRCLSSGIVEEKANEKASTTSRL